MKTPERIGKRHPHQKVWQFQQGQPPPLRMEDGLGDLPRRKRWKLRCKADHRCVGCGAPLPPLDYRVRCPACAAKRVEEQRRHRAAALLRKGDDYSLRRLARMVIG